MPPPRTRLLFAILSLFATAHPLMGVIWELDASYMTNTQGVNERVYALSIDSAKRLVAGGLFSTAGGASARGVTRFFQDGTRDPSFDIGSGIANGSYNYVTDLLVLPDDSIIIVGDFGSFNGASRGNIARIRANGSLDEHFAKDTGADGRIKHITHSGDGGYIIGGNFSTYAGTPRSRIAKLRGDGSLDPNVTFDHSFANDEWVDEIEVFPNGDVLAGGDFEPYGFMKFLANGSIDDSFEHDFFNYHNVESTLLTSDGKILIGAAGGLHRHHADGSYDPTFYAPLDDVYGLNELPDGRIVATGDFYGGSDIYNIAILDDSGDVDDSIAPPFEPSGWIGPTVLQDGYLIFAGAFSSLGNEWDTTATSHNRIARFQTAPATNPSNAVYFDRASITLIEDGAYAPTFYLRIDETPDSPIFVFLEVAETDFDFYDAAIPTIPNLVSVPWNGPNHTEVSVRSQQEDWNYQGIRRIVHRIRSVSGDAIIGEPSEIEIILVDKDPPPAVRFEKSHLEVVRDGNPWPESAHTITKVFYDSEPAQFVNLHIEKEAETQQIADSLDVFPDEYFNFQGGGYDTIYVNAYDDHNVDQPTRITLRLVAEEGYEHMLGSPTVMTVHTHHWTSLQGWLIHYYPDSWHNNNIHTIDSDNDGQPTLLEWLNNSNPLDASDAIHPIALAEHKDSQNNRYFSIRFYYSYEKADYAAVVEKKANLTDANWVAVWRSDDDPNFESELVLNSPSENGSTWAEIRLPSPMTTRDFVRIRYESTSE